MIGVMANRSVEPNLFLESVRVLDLTESGCMIGGRMLADLGAEVIQVEPPGGSPSRIAPFYKDIADPEKSLFWFAYNMNKRGITLDITKTDGRNIFERLVETADIVLESYEVGYMGRLGLGYDDLCDIKKDIIVASITPFGQSGPKAHYRGSDLTAWASGGYLYVCGDPDRPPNWMSFPQASQHAGAEAAAGAMTAFWHRFKTGEGQHVDVSMQECVVACNLNTTEMWDLNRVESTRFSWGVYLGTDKIQSRCVWKCNDGHVVLLAHGGAQVFVNSMKALVNWMVEEGMADDWLRDFDWETDYDASQLTQDLVDRYESAIAKFLETKTKKELYEEGAIERRIMTGPLATAKDVWENIQLRSRDFWVNVDHPELGESLTYPGAFIKLSESRMSPRRRAPLIGEHNREIYEKEMGLSIDEMTKLKQTGVI